MLFLYQVVLAQFPFIDLSKSSLIYNECVTAKQFAITIDDGPSLNIDRVLNSLAKKNVTATFFVNALNYANLVSNAESQRLLRAIDRAGHQIGSHSFSHADLALLGDSDLYDQVKQNEDAIYNVIGKRPKHFRLPYLSYNERVLAALGSWGYTVIGVNLDTKDYAHNNQPNEMSLNQDAYLAVMSQNPRSVISLNHDFTRGCAQWLEMMIDDARSRGFAFVTTEECTNIKGY